MMQPLVCPQCSTSIPDESIDIPNSLAICPNCSHTFDLPSIPNLLPKRKTRVLSVPHRVQVYQSDDGHLLMVINKRHWGELMGLVPFALLWNVIIWLIFWSTLDVGSRFTTLFLGLFGLVGLFLAAQCVDKLVNRTKILVDEQGIAITGGPLPPYRRLAIDDGDVQDVYYVQRVSNAVKVNGVSVRPFDYEIYVVRGNDSHQRIFTADTEPIALYVGERLKATFRLGGEFRRESPASAYWSHPALQQWLDDNTEKPKRDDR